MIMVSRQYKLSTYTFGVAHVGLIILTILFGMLIMRANYREWATYKRLSDSGNESLATIISQQSGSVYYIQYRFTAQTEDGQLNEYTYTEGIDRLAFDQLHITSKQVIVLFDPHNPEIVRIKRDQYLVFNGFLLAGMVSLFVGIVWPLTYIAAGYKFQFGALFDRFSPSP
jgi:hypothetical protein